MLNKILNKILKRKNFIIKFIWRVFQLAFKQGMPLLVFAISAKTLSVFEFGVYNYVFAVVMLMIVFADFGISISACKYVAEFNILSKDKVKLVLFNSGIVIFLVFILLFISVIVTKNFWGDNYKYILISSPLIFLIPITSLFDGIFRGLKKFKEISVITIIAGVISIPLMLLSIYKLGLIGSLIALSIFYFILLLSFLINHKEYSFKFDKYVAKKVFGYSFIYGVAIIGYFLFTRINIVIMGKFGYFEAISYYELLNKFFWVLLFPFAIIGQVIAPDYSEKAAEKKYNLIYEKTKKITILLIVISFLLGIVLYFLTPLFLKIFFNEYYNAEMLKILPISLGLFMVSVCANPVDAGIIVPSGYAKLMSIFYIILGGINIGLVFVFNHFFGYLGIMSASLISAFLMLVCIRVSFLMKIKKLVVD